MKQTCANCKFFSPDYTGNEAHQCRRYPPAFASKDDGFISAFVQTHSDEWCGEHEWAFDPAAKESTNV
ncbi:MAG: hypothetical protein AAFW60_01845 [Pseudomonadota bacterium]